MFSMYAQVLTLRRIVQYCTSSHCFLTSNTGSKMALIPRRCGALSTVLALIACVDSVWSVEAVDGTVGTESCAEGAALEYGVDISFPMHHRNVSSNFAWLDESTEEHKGTPVQPLGDKQTFYNELIGRCMDFYGDKGHLCAQSEIDRIAMSLRQPQSMKVRRCERVKRPFHL